MKTKYYYIIGKLTGTLYVYKIENGKAFYRPVTLDNYTRQWSESIWTPQQMHEQPHLISACKARKYIQSQHSQKYIASIIGGIQSKLRPI